MQQPQPCHHTHTGFNGSFITIELGDRHFYLQKKKSIPNFISIGKYQADCRYLASLANPFWRENMVKDCRLFIFSFLDTLSK